LNHHLVLGKWQTLHVKSEEPCWVVACHAGIRAQTCCLGGHWIINMRCCHCTDVFSHPVLTWLSFSDDKSDLKDKLDMEAFASPHLRHLCVSTVPFNQWTSNTEERNISYPPVLVDTGVTSTICVQHSQEEVGWRLTFFFLTHGWSEFKGFIWLARSKSRSHGCIIWQQN